MAKKNPKPCTCRHSSLLLFVLAAVMLLTTLTGCGTAGSASVANAGLAQALNVETESQYQAKNLAEVGDGTTVAASPKATQAQTPTVLTPYSYNRDVQYDGVQGNEFNFGVNVFVPGMTTEQALSIFYEHLNRDAAMAAATIAGVGDKLGLEEVQMAEKQQYAVQIDRINAAAQHYLADPAYWQQDVELVKNSLKQMNVSVEEIGEYHSACYQSWQGEGNIPLVKVCTSSHTGGHALTFKSGDIVLRFRLECGFQLVDVLIISAPETVPDEPETTTTTTTTTTTEPTATTTTTEPTTSEVTTTSTEETTSTKPTTTTSTSTSTSTTTTTTTTTLTTTSTTETTTTTTTVVSVVINKVDVAGAEVPGATLTLTGKDPNGGTIKFSKDQLVPGAGVSVIQSSGNALIWVSGTSPTNITGLKDGDYILHEETPPTGYVVANDIPFSVRGGKVTSEVINMVDEAEETTTTTTTTATTTTMPTTTETTETTSKETTTETTTKATTTESTTTSTSTTATTTTTSETTTEVTTTLEPKNTDQGVDVSDDDDNGGTATETADTTPSEEPTWPSAAKPAPKPAPPEATPVDDANEMLLPSAAPQEFVIEENAANVTEAQAEPASTSVNEIDTGNSINIEEVDYGGTDAGQMVDSVVIITPVFYLVE